MNIQLSDHFTYKKLLRFTLPSIVMMIFTSIYSVVDGFFVSNFVGKTAFTAVNFIMPFLMILGAVGFMFGTGGSALVGKYLGQGQTQKANGVFSLIVYASAGLGLVIAVMGIVLLRPIASALGATGQMLEDCVTYGRIILAALPAFMLQYEFQSFFVTAEKPTLGLWITVAAGGTNMVLDALLVPTDLWGTGLGLGMGLEGAALATALSQCVGGLIPLLYFFKTKTGTLTLTKTRWDGGALLRTCTNGSSELMANISMSLVGILYNARLLKYAGEDGVAAYGVLMYVNFVFLAVFIGYAVGCAPIISFHYGAGNHRELKGVRQKSTVIIAIFSLAMLAAGEGLAKPATNLFVGYDPSLHQLTLEGFMIFSFSFLFAGMAIFGSAFFTALNNGPVSAAISFLRTLVFQVAAVLLLPLLWDVTGIWISVVAAEMMAMAVTVFFMVKLQKKYQY